MCKVALRGLGQLPVRVGGMTIGWHFFLGELADLSEQIKPLRPLSLREMRPTGIYDHDFSLPQR